MKRFTWPMALLLLSLSPGGGFVLSSTLASEPSATPCSSANAANEDNEHPARRTLDETGLRQMLTAALQADYVRDKGELELRLIRSWTPLPVPNEPLRLTILELPTLGVTPSFIVRFQLRAGNTVLGVWQMPVAAKVFRDVWVARSALLRGQLLSATDHVRERRDVLALREACWDGPPGDEALYELATNVPAGGPLYVSTVKPRTLVRRGQLVEAVLQDGALQVSLRAEALEDGAFGQTVRARNARSKAEFRGKVQDEQTILVVF